ncbi:MAG: hypothetical protein M3Q81_02900 [bacterium]|nr:hypothetical protein [bacterium]
MWLYRWWYYMVFIGATALFLLHYLIVGQAVYGDGIGYYAHLHSWVIDADWDATNEYKHLYQVENNNAMVPLSADTVPIVSSDQDGRALNPYSPVVAVLLLPFYLLAHLITQVLNLAGVAISTTGYGDPYQILTGLGAICYMIAGVVCLEKSLLYFGVGRIERRVITGSLFLGSNLLYYGSVDVINSHFASFFLICFFLYHLFNHDESWRKQAVLGFTTGLLTANRPQDGLVLLVWLAYYLLDKKSLSASAIVVFIFGGLFGVLPLVLHWLQTFSGIANHTYVESMSRDSSFLSSQVLLGSLVTPWTGLFSTTPLLLAVVVLFIYYRCHLNLKMIGLVAFFICQYLVISWQGGWAAAAYGGRMYISSLPLFAVMMGAFQDKVLTHKAFKYGLFCAILINAVSIVIFMLRDS